MTLQCKIPMDMKLRSPKKICNEEITNKLS